jgi:steroid 5-alpha reductase family enzyme
MMALFAGSWSLRLGLHILSDRVIGKKEDGRYLDLIAGWGSDAPRKLFLFFQYQAVFVVVFSLPFVPLALAHRGPGFPQMILAVLIWCVAIGGESLADAQLARWRREPSNRGRTCRTGLWGYSRHPNYFFEWLHWWTYVILGATAANGWVTLLGPVLMLLFLYRVTGIPYTEAQALRSRGEDYRQYQQTVSAFFPWFPREAP